MGKEEKKMKNLMNSQLIRYVMTGGMTTIINYVVYLGLLSLGVTYLLTNTVAWICAVIFAFYANRQVVFQSKGEKGKEFVHFFTIRLGTLLVENALLFILIDYIGVQSMISKVMVSIITVSLNYIACKYGVFKERSVSGE